MTVTDVVTQKFCPRWVKLLLIASLALNVAIGGAILGAALRGTPPSGAAGSPPDGISIIARAMPPAYQSQLRQYLRDTRTVLQPDRRVLLGLGRRLVLALEAEPFEPETIRAIFADQRNMLDNIQKAGHEALLKQIVKMTPAERTAFARKLTGMQRPANAPRVAPPVAITRP